MSTLVADHDSGPIGYMQRTRSYYAALGYAPYQWATFPTVPFVRSPRVAQSRLVLITTAARFDPNLGDQGPGAAYNAAAKFFCTYRVPIDPPPDLRISHIAYDRTHTTAADPNTWLPARALQRAVSAGSIGALANDVIGMPTDRSQRATQQRDAPAVLDACRDLRADIALFVPNCPVCHQSVSLVSRHLEANGIATVVMGCARDIVEHVGVARFLFSDFPLGNSAGKPFDEESQRATLEQALALFESATGPRTTVASPIMWSTDARWKNDYLNVDAMPAAELARRRAEFAQQKEVAQRIREGAK